LPTHVHGHRQQPNGGLPVPQTTIPTKESSHGQYIPTGRSLRRGHGFQVQTFLYTTTYTQILQRWQ
jgi:hypothetical protein